MVNGLQHPKHIQNLLPDMVHFLKTTGGIQLFGGKGIPVYFMVLRHCGSLTLM